MDDYLAWLEDTPSDLLPPGEDVSDLGMLGRTLYEQVDRDEVARRVAVALQHGRSWHEISYYLGKTESAARAEYGPAERPQLVVSGFGHLDVSALVRPLPRRVVRGSQMSAILAVPVPIEVMAMARAGGADGC